MKHTSYVFNLTFLRDRRRQRRGERCLKVAKARYNMCRYIITKALVLSFAWFDVPNKEQNKEI